MWWEKGNVVLGESGKVKKRNKSKINYIMMSQKVWQGNNSMFFEGDHDLFFFLFRQEIYSTGLHRSKCTSDMCKRAHASTQTHKQTRRNTITGKHSPKRLCKNVFTSENWKKKKSKMRRWKMTTPTKERPCCDWGRKQVKLSLVIN